MDTKQESFPLKYTPQTVPQTQLWVGRHEQLVENTITFLQQLLCQKNGCKKCTTCIHIKEKQHHAVLWVEPEKSYTIDDLKNIFSTIAFSLPQDELFFFIIQKADFLTPICANKLLKPIEEPPQGYHFILLAERTEQILPTIRSRCIIHTCTKNNNYKTTHPLFTCFTSNPITPLEFSRLIDQTLINERESVELLDEILHYWIQKYKKNMCASAQESQKAQKIISVLKKASLQPPMPGSSKIFWRNLYLITQNKHF